MLFWGAVAGGADGAAVFDSLAGVFCCVPGVDGCAGAAGAVTGARSSKIVADGLRPAKYPSVSEVIMKTIAMPLVSFVRKFPAPLLPKMVALDPPKTAPTSAPLPVCSNTTRIKPILTIT